MKIEVFAVCYNEERIMPYFLRHYSQFAKIFIFDNYSTDRSVEIAQKGGANVSLFDTKGTFDDGTNLEIKEHCWRDSQADWVIVIDLDEFVYHPHIVDFLNKSLGTLIQPNMYEMFTPVFPTTTGQIYEEVISGHPSWPKINLIQPSQIKEMNYIPGCHLATPKGNVALVNTNEIKTLHMKHLGRQYTIDRNIMYGARLSKRNKKMGWGTHLLRTPKQVGADFDRLIKIVIPRI